MLIWCVGGGGRGREMESTSTRYRGIYLSLCIFAAIEFRQNSVERDINAAFVYHLIGGRKMSCHTAGNDISPADWPVIWPFFYLFYGTKLSATSKKKKKIAASRFDIDSRFFRNV